VRLELLTQISTFRYQGITYASGDPDSSEHSNRDHFTHLLADNFEPLSWVEHPLYPGELSYNYGVFQVRFEKVAHWRDAKPTRDPRDLAASEGRSVALKTQLATTPFSGQTHYSADPDSESHNSYDSLDAVFAQSFHVLDQTEDSVYPGQAHNHFGVIKVTLESLPHWRNESRQKQQRYRDGTVPVGAIGPRSRVSPLAALERVR
jgi:hypothetical protein